DELALRAAHVVGLVGARSARATAGARGRTRQAALAHRAHRRNSAHLGGRGLRITRRGCCAGSGGSRAESFRRRARGSRTALRIPAWAPRRALADLRPESASLRRSSTFLRSAVGALATEGHRLDLAAGEGQGLEQLLALQLRRLVRLARIV